MAKLKSWLRRKIWDEWLHDPAQVGASGSCIFLLIMIIIATLLLNLLFKLRDYFGR